MFMAFAIHSILVAANQLFFQRTTDSLASQLRRSASREQMCSTFHTQSAEPRSQLPKNTRITQCSKCATAFLLTFIEGALLPHELAGATTRGRSDCSSRFPSRKEEFDSPSLRSRAFFSFSMHRGRLLTNFARCVTCCICPNSEAEELTCLESVLCPQSPLVMHLLLDNGI